MEKKHQKEEKNKQEAQFQKEAVLKSEKYGAHLDLLSALLEDGRGYTSTEIDNVIEKFQKGMVK